MVVTGSGARDTKRRITDHSSARVHTNASISVNDNTLTAMTFKLRAP